MPLALTKGMILSEKPPVAVSAIVPFYGDPAGVLPLLEALGDQTLAPAQIIVVDDASPTPFPQTPGITLVRRESNGGFGTAVNTAAELATGDYLLILNSDLSIPETLIADLAKSLSGRTIVASPFVIEGGRAAHVGRRKPTVSRLFFSWLTPLARWRDRPLWRRLVGHGEPGDENADWVVGACLLVPTSAFRQVSGFDERFHMNSEEVDLQRRLAAKGVRASVLTDIVVQHESGGSSDPLYRRQWLVEGWFRYFNKWGGVTRLRWALLAATGINFLWNLGRRVRGLKVNPIATCREERELISHGWRARQGKAVT